MQTHRQTVDPAVYLVSPPPPWWRPDGGNEGNGRAEASKGRDIIDYRRVLRAWIAFCDAITKEGGTAIVMPYSCGSLFDTTYIRDTCFHVPKRGYVMSHMRAAHRRGEPEYVESFLRFALGVPVYGYMRNVFEGDSCIFMLPNCTGIVFGYGSRADFAAAAELEQLFGLPVTALPLKREFFHLDVAAASIAGGMPTVVACRDAFATVQAWEHLAEACRRDESIIVEVSVQDATAYATNFINVNGTLFLPPRTSSAYRGHLRSLGYKVREVDLGDLLEKGGGSAACASNHASEVLSHMSADALAQYGWSTVRKTYVATASA